MTSCYTLRCRAQDLSSLPIVLVIPGLTGDSSAGYVARLCCHLHQRGHKFRPVAYNPRGRGGNDLEEPFLYSAGYTEDLRRVVSHLRSQHPQAAGIYAVGFSLGANVLGKLAGEVGGTGGAAAGWKLDGCVCVCAPLDCLSMSNGLANSLAGRLMDSILGSSAGAIAVADDSLALVVPAPVTSITCAAVQSALCKR